MAKLKLVKKVVTCRFYGHRPFILSHLITNRCNLNCLMCLWKEEPDAKTNELSTEQVIQLYREAKDCGFLGVVIWGGEPLLRRDLGHILKEAKGIGLKTSIITSAYFLPDRYGEVASYLHTLLVSIDAPDESNDRIRGRKGSFKRALQGIERVRSEFPQTEVLLISVVSRLNKDRIEDLIRFSHAMGIPITFQSMNCEDYGFVEREINVADLMLSRKEEREVFTVISEYKRMGYKITNSHHYISAFRDGKKNYRCHNKKIVLRVEADGGIVDCIARRRVLVNVLQKPLREILANEAFQNFLKRAEKCCRCWDSGTMECSFLWELRPETLWNAVKMSPV